MIRIREDHVKRAIELLTAARDAGEAHFCCNALKEAVSEIEQCDYFTHARTINDFMARHLRAAGLHTDGTWDRNPATKQDRIHLRIAFMEELLEEFKDDQDRCTSSD